MDDFCVVGDSDDDDDGSICIGMPPTARSRSPCEDGDGDEHVLLVESFTRHRNTSRRSRASDVPRRVSAVRTCTALTVRAPTPEPRYDRPDTNRMDQIFECASSVDRKVARICACVRALGSTDPALIEEVEGLLATLPPEAMAMARQASALCEESAVQVSLMRQVLSEELVDLEVRAVRVTERQRALRASGRDEEASVLARSIAAAQRVDTAMTTLHPHASYSMPGAALVNGPMLALSRRADDRS